MANIYLNNNMIF